MTLVWMDAARYGDTSVFHDDGPRDMWPWRDWVLRAYRDNMPFDQFTIEQIAGDLLPEASLEQRSPPASTATTPPLMKAGPSPRNSGWNMWSTGSRPHPMSGWG